MEFLSLLCPVYPSHQVNGGNLAQLLDQDHDRVRVELPYKKIDALMASTQLVSQASVILCIIYPSSPNTAFPEQSSLALACVA